MDENDMQGWIPKPENSQLVHIILQNYSIWDNKKTK